MIIASIGTKRPQAVNAVGVPNKDFCINDTFILLHDNRYKDLTVCYVIANPIVPRGPIQK